MGHTYEIMASFVPLGRFVPWDVLYLGRFVPGTFCPLGCFVPGTFCPWDLMSGDVLSWDVLSVHRIQYAVGGRGHPPDDASFQNVQYVEGR